jgi:xanthine dehydrogenase/oxidase
MSLYALVRNSYDPVTKCFHLSEDDIEKEGHLDGNLCRCTGYKPILKAAKTFIVEDLKGQLISDSTSGSSVVDDDQKDIPYHSEMSKDVNKVKPFSCGRPGGCCRDVKMPAVGLGSPASSPEVLVLSDDSSDSLESDMTSSASSVSDDESKAPKKAQSMPTYDFKAYSPHTELLFPPALRKFNKSAIYFGDSKRVWLRPVTIQQLLQIKDSFPSAKLVGGSSEVQVEVRFKNTPFAVSVYISEIDELKGIKIPETEAAFAAMTELVIPANTPLTDVEETCKLIYAKLGQRAQVLEATRKQLRYFAGRQIRNVASLAGNIATASPISDMNPVLLAAKATLTCESMSKGKFQLPLATFFVSYRTTSLPADAIITHVHIPLAKPGSREITKAYKQAKRKDDDIAIVTSSFRVRLDDNGMVEDITLAYGGMAPTTVEAINTKKMLMGRLVSSCLVK